MYDYAILGGGIESLLNAFLISEFSKSKKILFITKSNYSFSNFSTTWGIGIRHISSLEGINFLSPYHKDIISKNTQDGGWLCKKASIGKDEAKWLKNRSKLCDIRSFCNKVDRFYNKQNQQNIIQWKLFIKQYKELFYDTNLKIGIQILKSTEIDYISGDFKKLAFDEHGFSFNAKKFCLNLVDNLIKKGVLFLHETEITYVHFTEKEEISYIESKNKIKFEAKNFIFVPGAYGNNLLKNFNLNHRVNGILGIWATVRDVHMEYPLKYYHFEDGFLKVCHSYTPINENSVIVAGGYAWIGEEIHNICSQQKVAFIENQKEIIQSLFPGKSIKINDDNCLRALSDNNLPIFKIGKTKNSGKYILIAGTGTSGSAAAAFNAKKTCKILGLI